MKRREFMENRDQFFMNRAAFSVIQDRFTMKRHEFMENRDQFFMNRAAFTVNQDRFTMICREITTTRGRFTVNQADHALVALVVGRISRHPHMVEFCGAGCAAKGSVV